MKILFSLLFLVISFLIFKLWIEHPEIDYKIKIIDMMLKVFKPLTGLETDHINRGLLNLSKYKPSYTNYFYINGIKIFPVKVKSLIDDYLIDVDVFLPESKENKKLPVLFYIHGGGWVLPSSDSKGDLFARDGFIYVEIDYRLSPEFKHPIPLEDCFSVLTWINQGNLGEFENFYIMGDSAGGNLAASLILLNRDRKTNYKIDKSVLIYPSIPTKIIGESKKKFENGYLLNAPFVNWFEKQYLRGEEDYHNRYVSPLNENNFDMVPPTLFIMATEDYLYSEGVEYRQKLEAYGVKVEYKDYFTVHGFYTITSLGEVARRDIISYLNKK